MFKKTGVATSLGVVKLPTPPTEVKADKKDVPESEKVSPKVK